MRVALLTVLVAAAAHADLPKVTVTPLSELTGYVAAITPGPDNAVWFVVASQNAIGRTPLSGGPASSYPVPTANAGLSAITIGPDGNLWFLEQTANKVGKITTGGAVTEYAITGGLQLPSTIAAGSDGNIWFTAYSGPTMKLGRFSTSGTQLATITLPGANASNVKLAAGPGAAIWFHDRGDNTAGFVTSSGAVQSFALKTPETAGGFIAAGNLTAGPDGNEWVGHSASVVRVTPSGGLTEYAVPGGKLITGVAAGSDGNIWFTDGGTANIGRLLVATAKDDGTATIDQGASGAKSPSELYALSRASGSSRRAALDVSCTSNAPQFVERDSATPPPHMDVMQVNVGPVPCADIEITNFDADFGRRPSIFAVVTNNGPNIADVTLVFTLPAGIVAGNAWGADCVSGLSGAQCRALLAPGKNFAAAVTIIKQGVTPAFTANAVATSSLPDPVPGNNAKSLTVDLENKLAFPKKPAAAPAPDHRGAH